MRRWRVTGAIPIGLGVGFLFAGSGCNLSGFPPAATASPGAEVRVNSQGLEPWQVRRLEAAYRVRVQPGAYWYDRRSGAWGLLGGPTLGFLAPNLPLGGPLRRDASNGRTGVVVNGRELHALDLAPLHRLVPVVLPGRYWMDAGGSYGHEGGPALGTLRASAPHREGILSTYDKVVRRW